MTNLSARDLRPFGAEVDFDLRRLEAGSDAEAFRDLLYERKVLVFRGQSLSPQEHMRVMAFIGPVLEDNQDMRVIEPEGRLGGGPLAFHSDLSFTSDPHIALALHALDVNDGETYTAFANGVRAFQQLSPEQRAEALKIEVLDRFSLQGSHRLVLPDEEAYFLPSDVHPAVRSHPVTGEPILYVNEAQTARVMGMEAGASEALLQSLFEVLYRPENIYRHDWRKGDLVVWDNLALQHARPDLSHVTRRSIQRVTVARGGFSDLCPDYDDHDPRVIALSKDPRIVAANFAKA